MHILLVNFDFVKILLVNLVIYYTPPA